MKIPIGPQRTAIKAVRILAHAARHIDEANFDRWRTMSDERYEAVIDALVILINCRNLVETQMQEEIDMYCEARTHMSSRAFICGDLDPLNN